MIGLYFGLFVYVAAKEDFGWEVVGVTTEEASGGVGSFGVADAVAFGVFEEVEVENFGFVEVPTVVGCADEVTGDDDLVEEVPLAFVCECADATLEDVPPGVVEAVGIDSVGFAFGPEGYGARFVHRVVVEVAHDDDAHVGVDSPEGVGDVFG